jgi:hypothetical protein
MHADIGSYEHHYQHQNYDELTEELFDHWGAPLPENVKVPGFHTPPPELINPVSATDHDCFVLLTIFSHFALETPLQQQEDDTISVNILHPHQRHLHAAHLSEARTKTAEPPEDHNAVCPWEPELATSDSSLWPHQFDRRTLAAAQAVLAFVLLLLMPALLFKLLRRQRAARQLSLQQFRARVAALPKDSTAGLLQVRQLAS